MGRRCAGMRPGWKNRAVLLVLAGVAAQMQGAAVPAASIEGRSIRVEFNGQLHSRVIAKFDGKEVALGDFSPSESVTVNDNAIQDFALTSHKTQTVHDEFGRGNRLSL